MAVKVVQYTSIIALEQEAEKRAKTLVETPISYSFSYKTRWNTGEVRVIEMHIYLKKV